MKVIINNGHFRFGFISKLKEDMVWCIGGVSGFFCVIEYVLFF
jgi:hypothetical protein